ncbi:MAG TPA: DUF1566 domain-containing protein [Planctomycetota bacterium]|nr:DUF1566 domain-containing protein [Planctomycetota bacterium]
MSLITMPRGVEWLHTHRGSVWVREVPMKKVLTVLGILALGAALGRFFDGTPPRVEAGGGNALPRCQDINGDGSSNVADAVFLLNWMFLGGPEPTCPETNGQPAGLPDTGQTRCYEQSLAEILCDGAVCPGQDGSYRTGCPSERRFTDNGDGTVTDHCTDLHWQKDTADVDGNGQLTGEDLLPWCDALAYCENLSFAGHDDWRLPNVRELQSIVDYGRSGPSIDSVLGAVSSAYWSSTSYADYPYVAWGVYFIHGNVNLDGKGNFYHVRAVRSRP